MREMWGSRWGFILAASGSAIGLGNLWRFPYLTGQQGGAAFVLLYLACVLFVGLPVMMAEVGLGRYTAKNPTGAFDMVAPRSLWRSVGFFYVIIGLGILSYYSVVAGWTIGYAWKTASGTFHALAEPGQTAEIFEAFVGDPGTMVGLHAIFMAFTALIVAGGVRQGIERWSAVLMPLLFFMLLGLVIQALTLEGAGRGITFYLQPDFSKVTGTTFLNALGQTFFSLSLGMGAMITYGSYLSKREDVISSTATVCFFDTLAAFLAGLVIFPTLFTMEGVEPTAGPPLVFIVLPSIFPFLPGSLFFGTVFFLLLVVAALTSSISLLEVSTAYLVDEWRWKRRWACLTIGLLAFLLGIPSALSLGTSEFLSKLPLVHRSALDVMDMVFGNVALTLGALLLCIFVGWRWSTHEVTPGVFQGSRFPYLANPWYLLIRYLCPLAIGAILLQILIGLLASSPIQ